MIRTTYTLTILFLAACSAPQPGVQPASVAPAADDLAARPELLSPEEAALRPDAEPTRWTEAFLKPAVVVAESIIVEGPAGLFEHTVARGDDVLFERSVSVTPEGLRQVVRPRAGGFEGEVVRAQLDAWQLAAFREVIFLERVDPNAPVIVRAVGNAMWRDTDGNVQRQPQLSFRGDVGQVQSPR